MQRDLAALEPRSFDLLVVGGGIVGACVARDAALRGLSVALVERDDFASGTSANSLKLVHGGLRYLQRLELRAMRESIRERSAWLRLAPHLVHPIPVLVPLYGEGLDRLPLLRAALAANDLLSADRNRGLAPDRRLPGGRAVSVDQCLELVPDLDPNGLRGGVVFYDAQMYSAERLVLAVVEGAVAAGAVAANYVECQSTQETGAGLLVRCLDRHGGATLRLRARMVVNATGSRAIQVGGQLGSERPPLRYSVAMNVVLAGRDYGSAFSVSASRTRGSVRGANRRLFVVPWRNRTMVGTAHFPLSGPAGAEPDPERYLTAFLEEINDAWSAGPVSRDDVLKTHFGLLPDAPGTNPEPVELLRRGLVLEDESPVVTVASVKFTTARALAALAVDRVVARLGRGDPRSRSIETPLPGAPSGSFAEFAAEAGRARPDLDPDVLDHLLRSYGTRYPQAAPPVGVSAERIIPGSPVLTTQFRYGVEEEMAMRAEDLIHRRTELGPTGSSSDEVIARAAVVMSGSAGGERDSALA